MITCIEKRLIDRCTGKVVLDKLEEVAKQSSLLMF